MKKKKRIDIIQLTREMPLFRILDFLIDNKGMDFTKKDIAENAGISRASLFNYWPELEKREIVKVTRAFGKTKLYTLNSKSIIVQKILELEKALISKALERTVLISKALERAQRNQEVKMLKKMERKISMIKQKATTDVIEIYDKEKDKYWKRELKKQKSKILEIINNEVDKFFKSFQTPKKQKEILIKKGNLNRLKENIKQKIKEV